MQSREARSGIRNLSNQPLRVPTNLDTVLIIAAPALVLLGGVIAAWGSLAGVVAIAVAALMVGAVRERRHNATVVMLTDRLMGALAIVVVVVVGQTAFSLIAQAPFATASIYLGVPLICAMLFVAYFVLLFWPRRS